MKLAHIASALVAGAIVFATLPAEAQTRRIRSTNWRQPDRGAVRYEGTPQRFAVELRFGPYWPAVDEEFGGDGPYTKFFGNEWRFHIGGEFDWQAVRIPWVGTLGPGIGLGYVSATGKGFKDGVLSDADPTNDTDTATEETSLTILPIHLSAVVRADELLRRTGFPLVPYGKIGIGVGLWWVDAGDKTAEVKQGNGSLVGEGMSYGVHWALGAALALDFLARRELSALDQETGVNHIYIFGEWMNQSLGLGANQMRVGTSTWMTGLTMEM